MSLQSQFTTPTTIQATEWTTLPTRYRRPGGLLEHSLHQKRGQPLDSFLEGPLYIPSLSRLFVVDIPYSRIFSIDPTIKEWKIGPNDLVVTYTGTVYFTDQGMTGLHDPTGRVLCFDLPSNNGDPNNANGASQHHIKPECVLSKGPSPNGLVMSEDESAVFVAMTHDNAVWYVPFYPNGSVQRVGRFASYYGIRGPDGMAMDITGNIFVVHSSLGVVFVHRPDGEVGWRICWDAGAGKKMTNLAYGGPDGTNLVFSRE
ncbi:SMP-30/gluconolactonase/LRE family protein [Aspergillus homomorphus CBS 101889]|uniref:Calcium-dependent phosphotriesterase n=1 Tax=Aspergillus homomorphus (strain CBS 101889) TaxID=1450537 RepID=A0A395HRY4_ASPHC|nr:calcium-dependent phosphotriesterase [Aspergillus homomorphus CBS 101889]RAL10711.1 calcium-dependent phosphotriesterase [Aspergillus homomorphus CBS 101889]